MHFKIGRADLIPTPKSREHTLSVERMVVLGCGGFVGSHLLDRLLQSPGVSIEGWDVSDDKIRQHVGDPRLTLHLESFAGVPAVPR